MFHYYDTDTIEIVPNMEPQVAVLKFRGVYEKEEEKKTDKKSLLSRFLRKK